MEPIDKEIIEFADDFFFRLSELQLKERIEDFKERQISLYTIMHLPINLMKTGHQKDIFWRMMLLMDHCFNSYPVRLSRLSKEKVNVPMEDMERRALKLEKQGLKDMPLGVYLQEIGQVELTTLLINKVDYYVGKEALYDEYIGGAISYIILNASKAYQNELRRLFEQNG